MKEDNGRRETSAQPQTSSSSDRKTSSRAPPLSSWWASEPNTPPDLNDTAAAAAAAEQQQKPPEKGSRLLIKFTRIGPTYPNSKEPLFRERCYLLTRQNTSGRPSKSGIVPAVDPVAECQMVCFLRETGQRRQERRAQSSGYLWNPFIGMWIIVAKSRRLCLEHSNENDIYKKDNKDYYTIHLGDRWCGSSANLKRTMVKTFVPMQEVSRQYLESWNNGTQAVFLSRVWESAKTGDGLAMAYRSIRKLFGSTDNDDTKKPKGSGK